MGLLVGNFESYLQLPLASPQVLKVNGVNHFSLIQILIYRGVISSWNGLMIGIFLHWENQVGKSVVCEESVVFVHPSLYPGPILGHFLLYYSTSIAHFSYSNQVKVCRVKLSV